MLYYIPEINLCWCVKDNSLSNVSKRHCGIKVQNHWFVDLYEAYYLMNYKECVVNVTDMGLYELIQMQSSNLPKDCVKYSDVLELLNTKLMNVDILCAYMTIRNQDQYLRKNLDKQQLEYIKNQLKSLPNKKHTEEYTLRNGNYQFYKELKMYQIDKGLPIYFQRFDDQIDINMIISIKEGLIGLMQNGDVRIIVIQNLEQQQQQQQL